MSIDAVAFPLPVVVKGYACLTGAEVELAKKDIDPARPSGTGDVPEPPVATAAEEPEKKAPRVISYAPGIVRHEAAEKATTYSVTA
jgi:hypothetical protein